MEKDVKVNTFAVDEVKNLEMRIAAAVVRTRETTDKEIRVEARNLQDSVYKCEVRAGKLVIFYKIKGVGHFYRFEQNEAQITLYLPANLALEHTTLEIGAGTVNLDAVPISCGSIDVEVGAGKWKAEQLSVSGVLSVKIGAGKAKMKKVTAGNINIECSVGSSVFSGKIDRDIKVGCGVGTCSFQLENKESDFNYDVSCALGSVKINKNGIKSLSSGKVYKNEAAQGIAVLECGLGSIELRTNEIRY